MATLTDIRSTNWQLSLQGAGYVAEGIADIRQCIDIILRTVKGSDALRPQFGSDIYQYIDKPVNLTIPNVKRSIIEAVAIWEKRVKIVSITHVVNGEQVQFFITYSLVDEDVTDTVQLYLRNNDLVIAPQPEQSLILQGFFPAVYQQLLLSVTLDGTAQLPTPPSFGFVSPAAMYSWVIANYGFLGTWYLLPDKIMLFVNAGLATAGTISITPLTINKYVFDIPVLEPTQLFRAAVAAPGSAPGVELDVKIENNLAAILAWLQANFSSFGTWDIENIVTGTGDFNPDDFNPDDFDTIGDYYQFVLYTPDSPERRRTRDRN
jgi:phage baseplate assembly protein W